MRAHTDLCVRTLLGLCALAAPAWLWAQSPIVSSYGIAPTPEEAGATDPFPSPRFGTVLAIDGRTAMATIPGDIAVGENEFGRVGVYAKSDDGWIRTATLIGTEESGGGLGIGIDIEGGKAVVASPRALYLYTRGKSDWRQSATVVLRAPELSFGGRVEMENGLIAAQVYEDRGDAGVESTVHIYTQQKQRLHRIAALRARDGLPNHSFGTGLAFEDHLLVAGSPDSETSPGVAYVYLRLGHFFFPVDRIMASDGAPADGFGSSVAVRKGVIAVGAPGADLGVDDEEFGRLRGNVYVFAPGRHGWREVQKINESGNPDPLRGLGQEVAIGRGLLAIRADDITGQFRGVERVYVYDWIDGSFQQGQEAAEFEGRIPDIDMSERQLIYSTQIWPVFTYYVTGHATILKFGNADAQP